MGQTRYVSCFIYVYTGKETSNYHVCTFLIITFMGLSVILSRENAGIRIKCRVNYLRHKINSDMDRA